MNDFDWTGVKPEDQVFTQSDMNRLTDVPNALLMLAEYERLLKVNPGNKKILHRIRMLKQQIRREREKENGMG